MAVYILHFESKYFHAKHYTGWTKGNSLQAVKKRFEKHKTGNGSKLMRSVFAKGTDVKIATVFINGDRTLERKIKKRTNAKKYCNICNNQLINYGDKIK